MHLHREAPDHWQTMLGDWGRSHERLGHLEVWWDQDCGRWLLVEHVPRAMVPSDVVKTLELDPLATPFRQRQWKAFRETGKLPLAFFIIQGDQGGHKLAYTTMEADLAQWYTGSPEPPKPGSLPYAPFDQRVLDQLKRLEWLHGTYRSITDTSGDSHEARQKMRQAIIDLIDSSMEETIDAAMPALLAMDLPRVESMPDYDAMTAKYVETGHLDAPAGDLTPAGRVTVPFPNQ